MEHVLQNNDFIGLEEVYTLGMSSIQYDVVNKRADNNQLSDMVRRENLRLNVFNQIHASFTSKQMIGPGDAQQQI